MEWDAEKNAPLTPNDVGHASERNVWWKCPRGHEYPASVRKRVRSDGCPRCRALLQQEKSLALQYPALADEWDRNLNGELRPEDVTAHTKRKVWWRCSKGHIWRAEIESRSNGCGCPYCAGREVWPGENDLQTFYPEIAAEWDDEKNGRLKPSEVSPGANRAVWWKCPKGHSYKMAVGSRTCRNSGCPYCAGRKVLPGFNDLASLYPEIAAQWHPTKNGLERPDQVTAGSSKKIWWRCQKGHEWLATPCTRTSTGCGCPYCANRKILTGYNDLASKKPKLAAEWDLEKNAPLTPDQVGTGSLRTVWWRCPKGHSYRSSIDSRVRKNSGCPYCSLRRVKPEINDFKTRFPELAAQWDEEKNGGNVPDGMKCTSRFRAWWKCGRGHSYQVPVFNRIYNGVNCPYCSGKRVLAGYNDLATLRPDLALQWHPALNAPLTPQQVTTGSGKKVWWRCSEGHVWRAAVFNRTGANGTGCPVCSGRVSGKRQAYYKNLEEQAWQTARSMREQA